MNRHFFHLVLFLATPLPLKFLAQSPPAAIVTVFRAGENGYRCFRIPAIVRSPQGMLLAFAEGRANDCGDVRQRLLARSERGGEVWDSAWFAADLPDPVCQGSLLNVTKNGESALLHSNAASERERCCLTVKISADEGGSWQTLHEIYAGSAAYSDLVLLNEEAAGVLFEADEYGRICFVRFGF